LRLASLRVVVVNLEIFNAKAQRPLRGIKAVKSKLVRRNE
jgi:hypothetical protein